MHLALIPGALRGPQKTTIPFCYNNERHNKHRDICSILLKVLSPVRFNCAASTMDALPRTISHPLSPLFRCFLFCSRGPRYEVEDISSRVKNRDRTEGGNASAHCANRTPKSGSAQRSAEDCVGMSEADTQLTGLPRHNLL